MRLFVPEASIFVLEFDNAAFHKFDSGFEVIVNLTGIPVIDFGRSVTIHHGPSLQATASRTAMLGRIVLRCRTYCDERAIRGFALIA
jgi:hypothetical protein